MKHMDREYRRIVKAAYKRAAQHFKLKVYPLVFFEAQREDDPFGWFETIPAKGEKTSRLFLRLKDHHGNWLPLQEIMDTLAHEMSHTVDESCFEHNREFALMYHKIAMFLLKHYY